MAIITDVSYIGGSYESAEANDGDLCIGDTHLMLYP
jgi:hypothetical protein